MTWSRSEYKTVSQAMPGDYTLRSTPYHNLTNHTGREMTRSQPQCESIKGKEGEG